MLLLLLFVKCKINFDNVIIFSFIEFEGEYLKESIANKDVIYEFVIVFFEIFKDEKEIYNRNLKLLSQIFLIEIEELDEKEEFLIERILQKPDQLELFISFLSILSQILKEEDYDQESIIYSLEKINEIIDAENIKVNANKKSKREKYILNKEEFEIILNFINLKIKDKESTKGKEYFNLHLEFFINLLSFIDNYFSLSEVYEDISCRNLLYKKIFSSISKLQMINIEENDNENINELISFIKQLLNIIKKNTLNFFVDFEIIHKYLNNSLYKFSKIEKDDINIIHFKLIYSTLIFIITQLKVIYGIPTSIIKLHNDIIKTISKNNEEYKDYLSDINLNEFQSNTPDKEKKYNNKFYQYLTKIYSSNPNNKEKLLLNNNDFKYLINVLQNKLCGKNSPLIIYYKSQGSKINNNEKKTKDNLNDYMVAEDFDNLIIEEERNANDTLILSINESSNNLMDMSLKMKKNEIIEAEEESEENSYFNDNYSQNINLPEKDEEDYSKKIDITSEMDTSFKEEKSMSGFKL